MPDRRNGGMRFDVNVEVETDDETGRFAIKVRPNEERHRWEDSDGGRVLYDKLDDVYFTEGAIHEAFQKVAEHVLEKNYKMHPPLISSAQEYWESRVTVIRESFRSPHTDRTLVDKSEDFLEELSEDELNFVILSLDLVGSTKLANSLPAKSYSAATRALLHELSEIVPMFRGYVLKYTGDGLIAYFPEPTFITMHDLAIDCALTMRGTVRHALNKVLKEQGLPELDVRIGLDSGQVAIEVIGSAAAKRHRDLIGAVVSLAAKVQSIGEPGDILYGETVERHLHTNWRRHSEEIALPPEWPYSGPDGERYHVYRTKLP